MMALFTYSREEKRSEMIIFRISQTSENVCTYIHDRLLEACADCGFATVKISPLRPLLILHSAIVSTAVNSEYFLILILMRPMVITITTMMKIKVFFLSISCSFFILRATAVCIHTCLCARNHQEIHKTKISPIFVVVVIIIIFFLLLYSLFRHMYLQ